MAGANPPPGPPRPPPWPKPPPPAPRPPRPAPPAAASALAWAVGLPDESGGAADSAGRGMNPGGKPATFDAALPPRPPRPVRFTWPDGLTAIPHSTLFSPTVPGPRNRATVSPAVFTIAIRTESV